MIDPAEAALVQNAERVTQETRDRLLAGTPPLFRMATALCERLEWGSLVATLPNGAALYFEGREAPENRGVLHVRDYRFARRTLFGGSIGFFESYLDDMWETPDLAGFLEVFAANADAVQKVFTGNAFFRMVNGVNHWMNRNTKAGSRRNIMAHYDLGNAFYEKWLDGTMTYSSALFETGSEDLETAQTNKYRALARRMQLKRDETVLEIG
ncbi:MAG: class I SAM-dependent methyltransferase, partial [Pseudomonadota bacterium]